MIRQIINILLLLPLLGLSFSAFALPTTPLDGSYHYFETYQNYSVTTHLTPGYSKSNSFGHQGCHGAFDVVNDHLTYNTSVDTKCMWTWGTQGDDWVLYKGITTESTPWPAGDGTDGPLSANFSNLLIFSITQTEGSQSNVFDQVIAVTPVNGSLALSSGVKVTKNVAGTSDTGDTLTDDMLYKLSLALQEAAPAALNNASLVGRYSIRIESNEAGCSNGAPPDSCTEIYSELETEYLEIIFDGNGDCTIPVVSRRDAREILGTNQTKIIQYRDDKIWSDPNINNANIGSDWSVIGCTYSVANNKLAFTMTELVNGADQSTAESSTTSNLMLSADALYFKSEDDPAYGELPSYFGMKISTALVSGDVEDSTYLVSSIAFSDYDYDRNNPTTPDYGDSAMNLSVYNAQRYALSFTSDACTMEKAYDLSMSASVASGALKMKTKGSYITPSCSYSVDSTGKKLNVSFDFDIFTVGFSAYFSDDFNVITMNHKSRGATTAAAVLPEWESTRDRVTFISGYGILLDSAIQNPDSAINNWVDPKHWVSIKPPVLVPVISLLLLF